MYWNYINHNMLQIQHMNPAQKMCMRFFPAKAKLGTLSVPCSIVKEKMSMLFKRALKQECALIWKILRPTLRNPYHSFKPL